MLRFSRNSTKTRVSSLVITAWTRVIMWFWRERAGQWNFPNECEQRNETKIDTASGGRLAASSSPSWLPSSRSCFFCFVKGCGETRSFSAHFHRGQETVSIERGKKDFEFSFNRILYLRTPRNFVRRDFDVIHISASSINSWIMNREFVFSRYLME